MTPRQIVVVTCAYLVELVAVVYFTRAISRRFVGALAGGAAVGFMGIGAIVLGNALGLWRVPIVWTPYFVVLFYLGFVVSVTPIYLVTWRLARRFGWRALAVFTCLVAIIGPPRDYLFAATFPAWMVFAPGVAPIIADAPGLYRYRDAGTRRHAPHRRRSPRGSVTQRILITPEQVARASDPRLPFGGIKNSG